jgi:hypothetical protein
LHPARRAVVLAGIGSGGSVPPVMWWRKGLAAAAVGLLTVLCGCSATAQVTLDAQPNGTGVVTVTVTLDRAATASVGDVATELQTSDLAAAGWTVHGPNAGPNATTVVTAAKPFATLSQASSIVEEIAGSGPAASRPFQVALSQHRSFWKTTTVLSGDVDLRCGLACFGDAGLRKTIGSSTGIDPTTAQRDTGVDPTAIFHFGMAINLPGKLRSSDAATEMVGKTITRLRWTPTLGTELPLLAMTEVPNTAHIREVKEVATGGGIAVVVIVSLGVWWALRGRRRRLASQQHRKE